MRLSSSTMGRWPLSTIPSFQSGLLHLELFNVYLAKGETEVTDKDYFYGRSAEHLFASGAWKDKSIKFENYVWLTNYYYNQAVSGRDYDKAKDLYINLIRTYLSSR